MTTRKRGVLRLVVPAVVDDQFEDDDNDDATLGVSSKTVSIDAPGIVGCSVTSREMYLLLLLVLLLFV
jgi:hypothetical protein